MPPRRAAPWTCPCPCRRWGSQKPAPSPARFPCAHDTGTAGIWHRSTPGRDAEDPLVFPLFLRNSRPGTPFAFHLLPSPAVTPIASGPNRKESTMTDDRRSEFTARTDATVSEGASAPGEHVRTDKNAPDANPDAITGAPGSHPVGTGVGAAAAGAAGAAIGMAAGPIGSAVGAVVGAVAGGLAGKGVAEAVNPTAEDAYWRENYRSRPYYEHGTEYEQYAPAYTYG